MDKKSQALLTSKAVRAEINRRRDAELRAMREAVALIARARAGSVK